MAPTSIQASIASPPRACGSSATTSPGSRSSASRDSTTSAARTVWWRRSSGADAHGLVLRGGKVVALWSETDVTWAVRAHGRDVHLLAADGHDLTPPTLARGALVPSLADGAPIYLV